MGHIHGDMSMGSMSSMALPALTEFPKFYYAVVGSAVAVATLVNIYNKALYRQRLSAARAGTLSPAKPKSWFSLWNATLFALTREASNFSVRLPLKGRLLRLPTIGRTSLVLANVVVLLVLCFYGLDLTDMFQKEDVGFRCGVVTLGQLPLIFSLSGKNNVIGFFTGVSYEHLNWLHRWTARCMLFTATIHMGFFLTGTLTFPFFWQHNVCLHLHSLGSLRLLSDPTQAKRTCLARTGSLVRPRVDQLQFVNTHPRVELRAVHRSTCRFVLLAHWLCIRPRSARAAGLRVGRSRSVLL